MCIPGKVLIDNTCNTKVTAPNCNVAISVAGTQICVACKSGYAFKGATSQTCDTVVSGNLLGCARVSDDGRWCIGPCNSSLGYWMHDVNYCTKDEEEDIMIDKLKAAYPNFFSNDQIQNASKIIQSARSSGVDDKAQLAYILATAVGESELTPIKEQRCPVGTSCWEA